MPETESNPRTDLSRFDDSSSESATLATEEISPENDPQHSRNFGLAIFYMILMRVGWIFKTESIIMPAVLDVIGGAGWLRGCLPQPFWAEHSATTGFGSSAQLAIQEIWIVRYHVDDGALLSFAFGGLVRDRRTKEFLAAGDFPGDLRRLLYRHWHQYAFAQHDHRKADQGEASRRDVFVRDGSRFHHGRDLCLAVAEDLVGR